MTLPSSYKDGDDGWSASQSSPRMTLRVRRSLLVLVMALLLVLSELRGSAAAEEGQALEAAPAESTEAIRNQIGGPADPVANADEPAAPSRKKAIPATEEGTNEARVGIDEQLGSFLPVDLTFTDENGNQVTLRQLLDKPTVLAMVYYTCPGICNPLLAGLAEVVDRSDILPGKDYRIVTVSFDPEDTPAIAKAKKRNYLTTLMKNGDKVPPESWSWLVGSKESIQALTKAVGFLYTRDESGEEYLHSAALMAISPEGKITRYLYGTTFLPFDLKMAMNEASEGRATPTITKLLLYCFSYDPQGRKYVFNLLRVMGVAILMTLASFFTYLVITGKKAGNQPAGNQPDSKAR